jgi:outer membrane protein
MHLANATHTFARAMARTAALGASLLLSSEAAAADAQAAPGAGSVSSPSDFSRFDYIAERFSEWKVILGGGAIIAPKFEGAKDVKVIPVPLFKARFADRVNVDPLGVSVEVLQTESFTLAARGGYELGRDDGDDRHLRGLGDVNAGGVVGATAAYALGPVKFTAALDKTVGGSEGLLAIVGAEATGVFGPVILSAAASATWADDNHMEAYFGVTRRQSARSGLSRYQAEAGIKRVDVQASATYLIDEHWLLRGQAGLGYLVGDAKDSPIVEKKAQPSAMLMVGYRF